MLTSPTRSAQAERRYTVVYEGDPNDTRILSGEPPAGRPITVSVGDLFADAVRSERHRNDLFDEIVSLRTARGALQARIEVLEAAITNARHMVAGGNAIGSTADMLRALDRLPEGSGLRPTSSEVRERAEMLDSAERGMRNALYPLVLAEGRPASSGEGG